MLNILSTITSIVRICVGFLAIYSTLIVPANAQTRSLHPNIFPLFGMWNGFDGKLNVVECTSVAEQSAEISFRLYSSSGSELQTSSFTIPAMGTWHHVIEKDLISNQYGIFRLNATDAELDGKISCTSVFYKLNESSNVPDYAFSELITAPLQGISAGILNSINPYGGVTSVNNWFHLANPLDTPFIATIELFDASGEAVNTIPVNLAAKERRDLGVAHTSGQTVLSYRITPQNNSHPYLASSARYLPQQNGFTYAFSLSGQQGACKGSKLFLSTMNPANNWLELLNTSDESLETSFRILDSLGNLLATVPISLNPREQQHVYVNQFLGENSVGAAQFDCSLNDASKLIANSIHYSASSYHWAYSSQMRKALASNGEALLSSSNSYLQMENWLRAHSLNSSPALVTRDQSTTQYISTGSTDSYISQPSNVVTSTSVEPSEGGLVGADLLRVIRDHSGAIRLILPVPLGVVEKTQSNYALSQVASGLSSPVALTSSNDGTNRLFISEKAGVVRVLENGSILGTPFMDISSRVSSTGEGGLLSFAFHPQHSSNRKIYVYYTDLSGNSVISEFLTDFNAPHNVDQSSERIVLTQTQPFSNHNGGLIKFGPDGFLYIALGDGGGAGDPLGAGQDLSTLLGAVLRIDIDGALPYGIPGDNPFVGDTSARDEIWAYGLRNPWKFSFDRLSKRMFLADVGQNAQEEVNILSNGANLGWNIKEGELCYSLDPCNINGLETPIITYNHDNSRSITGGFVYRGGNLPQLQGHYLYADFLSGKIWSASSSGAKQWKSREIVDSDLFISSFGEDEEGEIYLLDYVGSVHKLVQAP